MKRTVAVLFGGHSSEHEISKLSATYIISSIPLDKYNIIPVYITKAGAWLMYDGPLDNIRHVQWEKFGTPVILSPDTSHKGLLRIVGDKIKNIAIDIVFPVLHGQNGEDGTIQGLCEIAGIPYVGCGVLSSSICMDKAYTKIIVNALGIAQAKHILVLKSQMDDNIDEIAKRVRYELGYPCFVKPSNAGSSLGVSKAANKKELIKALHVAAEFDRKILVEKAMVGRELECAVLGNEDVKAANVGEILVEEGFYDFDSKYNSTESNTSISIDLPEEVRERIRQYSIDIFKAVDGTGMARVDFFYEVETDTVIFNEINTIPGFTAISLYPALWNEEGMSTEELVDELIELGFKRFS